MNAIHFADNLRCELLSEFSTFGISNNWMCIYPKIISMISGYLRLKIDVVANRKNPVKRQDFFPIMPS